MILHHGKISLFNAADVCAETLDRIGNSLCPTKNRFVARLFVIVKARLPIFIYHEKPFLCRKPKNRPPT